MIDVAQATCPSDPWTMYLTIGTIVILVIQTVIIALQTRIFSRQTKILEDQAKLSESVELSAKPLPRHPITTADNQLPLHVTNEGKGVATAPEVNCYIMNRSTGETMASGSSVLPSIGPGRYTDATVKLTGSAMWPNAYLQYYWTATGSNGRKYSGSAQASL